MLCTLAVTTYSEESGASRVEASKSRSLIASADDIPLNGSCAEDIKQFCPELLTIPKQSESTESNPTHRHLLVERVPWLGSETKNSNVRQRMLALKRNFTEFKKSYFQRARPAMKAGEFLSHFASSQNSRENGQNKGVKFLGGGMNMFGGGLQLPFFGGRTTAVFCLQRNIRRQRSSVAPDQQQVTGQCKTEVRSFMEQRAADVRRDKSLLGVCFQDITSHCNQTDLGNGRVLRCLKLHKSSLTGSCASAVTTRQMQSAEDVLLDAPLRVACTQDLSQECSHVGYGGGAKLSCLQAARPILTIKCRQELFRREVENSEDIRFNFRLSQTCAAEKQKFCEHEPLGRARAITCLQDNMKNEDFGIECKTELQKTLGHQAWDWRLDWRLRTLCHKDAHELCGSEVAAAANGTASEVRVETGVLECLKQRAGSVSEEGCSKHLQLRIAASMEDMRQDLPMLQACGQELRDHCQGVPSGEGRMQMCLESVKESLSKNCSGMLFRRSVLQSTNFKFKPRMARLCAVEKDKFCSKVPETGNEVAKCLQDHLQDPEMSTRCRQIVERDEVKSSGDIRLNPGLLAACQTDQQALCKDMLPGRGRVIKCLKDNRHMLNNPGCRIATTRMLTRAADNWKLDRPLAEACLEDVQKLCKNIPAGEGRVHECLRKVPQEVSPECQAAEARLEAQEAEDIRLKPMIMKVCSDAISTHCPNVHPGDSRVITCLQEKSTLPEFPSMCAKRMTALARRSALFVAFNPRVLRSCQQELEKQCPGMNATDVPGGVRCLLEGFQYSSLGCQSEVTRTVSISLNQYQHNGPLTKVCDADAVKFCGVDENSQMFVRPSSVKDCLLRSSGNITDACWKVVSLHLVSDRDDKIDRKGFRWNELKNRIKNANLSTEEHDEIAKRVFAEVATKLHTRNNGELSLEGLPVAVLLMIVGVICVGSGYFFYQRNQSKKTGKGYVVYDKS